MSAALLWTSELAILLIGHQGAFSWNLVEIHGSKVTPREGGTSGQAGGYRTGAIVNSRLVAALTETRIDWFDIGSAPIARLRASTDCDLPGVMAAFPSRRTGELVAVSERGVVRHVPASPVRRSRRISRPDC